MPTVALESTVFAQGLPSPENVETAFEIEQTVRSHGATPKTIGIVNGQVIVGLSEDQIRMLAKREHVAKVSQRDISVVVARRGQGATTVAGTAWIAHANGIEVVCTGGIGGIHRGNIFDVSNDLHVLGTTPVTVVCSGAKAILDMPATRQHLESIGVTVVGYQTDEMPAFYSRESGLDVDVRCDTVEEVAEIVRARRRVGLKHATLVVVPVPIQDEIPSSAIEPAIHGAIRDAESAGIRAADLTPFLLDRIAMVTAGRSLAANRSLLLNNAAVAADLAVQLSEPD